MEIVEWLKSAQEKVNEAELDQDLRAVAFGKVFDLLSGAQPPQVGRPATSAARGGHEGSAGSILDAVGRRLGLPSTVITEAVFEEDGNVGLTIPPSKLEKSKQAATRQLSLIFAAVRQAAGIEDWTSVPALRAVCDDYGKSDPPNFASAIGGMDEVFQIRGKGKSREVRVRKPGYEAAGKLLEDLFSEVVAEAPRR